MFRSDSRSDSPGNVFRSQPVIIYGHACTLIASGGGYAVMLGAKELAWAEQRLLAVARAGLALAEHPARARGAAP